MKRFVLFLCMLTTLALPLQCASDTFTDYQNYNHGYCPECNCYPCRCNGGNLEAPCASCPNGGVPQDDPVPGNAPTCNTCQKPEPCDPAPVCACNCGISLWWIGIGLAVTATAAAIIVSSNNGSRPGH